jgi:hypothetical protein
MAKSAMPVSKARTAYGLLSEIRKLILEEPKRYDQTAWKRDQCGIQKDLAPACGTTACVAGWVTVLKGNAALNSGSWNEAEDRPAISCEAQGILGIADQQAWELFDGDAAGYRWLPSGGETSSRIKAHANRGVKHITRFQQKYAKQLKAKRV